MIFLGTTKVAGGVPAIVDNLSSTSATNALSANQGKALKDLIDGIKLAVYPVGTIYETTSTDLDTTTKMGTYFGGTWEIYGAGKVIVGLDSTDTDFDTIGETRGSKYIQAHTHSVRGIRDTINTDSGGNGLKCSNGQGNNTGYGSYTNDIVGDVYGVTTGTAGNIQPSIVTYRYRRTA